MVDILSQGWADLRDAQVFALIESALPAWLQRQRWFGAKTRTIHSVRALGWVEIPAHTTGTPGNSLSSGFARASSIPAALFFVEIDYGDAAPDTYLLPLAFTGTADAGELITSRPESVIATFSTPSGTVVLHDASHREDLRLGLLAFIERNASLAISTAQTAGIWGRLDGRASSQFSQAQIPRNLTSRVGSAEQSNTSIIYGEDLILKDLPSPAAGRKPGC